MPRFVDPVSEKDIVIANTIRNLQSSSTDSFAFVRAGPRRKVVFHPNEVNAAIVTCGGLCPGLNTVIAGIVRCLYFNYSVSNIFGIKMGYRGFYSPELRPWVRLTPKIAERIHDLGGTFLGTSRGGFDLEKIISAIISAQLTHIFVIGGDGTHRGAAIISKELISRKMKCVVAGVPKTIDNDIGIIDRSFGFHSAVEQAERAVKSVAVEADCAQNGIGLVTVMGRSSGFIASFVTLASSHVDFCLIPEIPFTLEGKAGLFSQIKECLKVRGSCVVVIAEGAGQDLFPPNPEAKDESGNQRLSEIGPFLKGKISNHFKKLNIEVCIKYNEPKYMIRSVKANTYDSTLCSLLAQNVVHGGMAGYTDFTSGLVNNTTVYIPIPLIVKTSPTHVNPNGRTWERVRAHTHQKNFSRVAGTPDPY